MFPQLMLSGQGVPHGAMGQFISFIPHAYPLELT
jgi:hypothetical protein